MKKVLGAAMAVGVALAAPSAWAQVKIGALYPFSGGLALLGDESFRGLELAAEERNAAGGLKGQKIEIVKGDAVDPNQAVGEARRLTSVDKVPVVFGSYASSISLAATQVTELAGIPYFEMGAISDPITERGYKYVFRTNPTAKGFGAQMVDSVLDILGPALGGEGKALKVAIIHEDSLYGQTVAGFQAARAREKGVMIVDTLPYSAKSVDLTPLVLRLKTANVDVVLQTSYQNDTVLFFRQMKEQGLKLKAILGAGGGYSLADTMKAVGAENMEGALDLDFTQYKTNSAGAPGIDAFVVKYKAKYGSEPRSGHSLANYMGANVFFDVMTKARDLSGDAIREEIAKVDIAPGKTVTGWGVKFDAKGQNERASPYLMQWQGGELVTVHPPAAAIAKMKLGVGAK